MYALAIYGGTPSLIYLTLRPNCICTMPTPLRAKAFYEAKLEHSFTFIT
jgi:hypothetical protein